MNTTNVCITFDTNKTGKEVYQIHVNNIVEAIKINYQDPVFLEDIRQDLIFLRWQVDELLTKALFPKLSRKEKPVPPLEQAA